MAAARLNEVVRGRCSVSTDTALRLARYFGTSPQFWINLQAHYDLDIAERTLQRLSRWRGGVTAEARRRPGNR